MKTIAQLFTLVVLLSGCATCPVKNDNAGQATERESQPVPPKVSSDILMNASQQKTAESRPVAH